MRTVVIFYLLARAAAATCSTTGKTGTTYEYLLRALSSILVAVTGNLFWKALVALPISGVRKLLIRNSEKSGVILYIDI
jgi:hypothetical protein